MPSLFQIMDGSDEAIAFDALQKEFAEAEQPSLMQRFNQPSLPTTTLVYSAQMGTLSSSNPIGMTPFHYALYKRKYTCARFLLLKNPRALRSTNAEGDLPIHELARLPEEHRNAFFSDPEINELLDNFIKVPCEMENFIGNTPLDVVLKNHQTSVKELEAWVRLGCDISHADADGWHAIHYAAFKNNNVLLAYLLHHNPQFVLLRTQGGKGAQHCAAQEDNVEGLALCVQAGASLVAVDSTDNTPLHTAIRYGSWEAMGYLLSNGGMNNDHNFDGYTPLHLAILYFRHFGGHQDKIFSALFKFGADPFVKATDEDGLNAHRIAREHLSNEEYAVFKQAYERYNAATVMTPDMILYQLSQTLGAEQRTALIAVLDKALPRSQYCAIREQYHAMLIEALKLQATYHLPLEEAGMLGQLLQKLQDQPFPHEPFESSSQPTTVQKMLGLEQDLALADQTSDALPSSVRPGL